MKRRLRATLFILALFGGLLAFSVLINLARQRSAPTLTPTDAVGELFPAVQADAIIRIVVSDHRSGKRITLTRVPGDWQAVDGAGQPATVDLPNVTRMIQILATLRYNRVLEESNVANYGLAGDGNVSIDFDAGTSYHLRIGDATPYTDYTYVQRGTDPAIYLVSSGTLAPLTAALPTPTPTPRPTFPVTATLDATMAATALIGTQSVQIPSSAVMPSGTAQPGTPPEMLASPPPTP